MLTFAMTLDPKIVTTIVFAENSGADLSDFRSLAERDAGVELLSLQPRRIQASWGRGYMETSLVLDAARTSQKIVSATCLLWKTAGRYVIHNIADIIAKASPGKDLYINLRTYPRPWVDRWVYGTTARGLQLLEESLSEMPDTPDEPTEQRLYGIIRASEERAEQIQPAYTLNRLYLELAAGTDGPLQQPEATSQMAFAVDRQGNIARHFDLSRSYEFAERGSSDRGVDVRLVLVGDGSPAARLRGRAEHLARVASDGRN